MGHNPPIVQFVLRLTLQNGKNSWDRGIDVIAYCFIVLKLIHEGGIEMDDSDTVRELFLSPLPSW